MKVVKSRSLQSPHGFGTRDLPKTDVDALFPVQKHTARILIVREVDKEAVSRIVADGLVSDCRGATLAIVTADCAPILLEGVRKDGEPVVGAVHAGWRGAVGGVLENAVAAFRELGAVRWRAVIGPCAGSDSYEVDSEFRRWVLKLRPEAEAFFVDRDGRITFSLSAWCASVLRDLGAAQVEDLNVDTIKDERFFSYRRAFLRGEIESGRQVSYISVSDVSVA